MDWDASHCPLPPIPNALKFLVMYNGYVCWFWWSHCRWYNILLLYIFTPMSKDIQSEWSICFRWETQLCFVTRRARVTNHGLAASDWGCQRLEMPLAFYWSYMPYDALWCCIMLYDAIWFRYIAMVPNSRCGCFFLPTRRCLKMVDGVWSLKSQERVKRGCQLFLKQRVVAFYWPPDNTLKRVAIYSWNRGCCLLLPTTDASSRSMIFHMLSLLRTLSSL